MLHCGDPIQYADINTSYWQSHFYACGIHFLNGVWGSAADKHIIKRSNTVLICHGILIDSNTGKRCAVKMEGNALNQVILRRFDDLKITSFENIIEIDL